MTWNWRYINAKGFSNPLFFLLLQIGQGGQIPTSYYLQQASQDDMTSVTISNGEKFTENVNIGKAGVVLWLG